VTTGERAALGFHFRRPINFGGRPEGARCRSGCSPAVLIGHTHSRPAGSSSVIDRPRACHLTALGGGVEALNLEENALRRRRTALRGAFKSSSSSASRRRRSFKCLSALAAERRLRFVIENVARKRWAISSQEENVPSRRRGERSQRSICGKTPPA
jgi:hypothetical protein